MRERLDELTAILAEEKKMSKLNLVLSLLVALLSGVVIGLLLAPKRQKTVIVGSGNGCAFNNGENDCCECEDDCDSDCEFCTEERCCGEHERCDREVCCCEDGEELEEEVQEKADESDEEQGYIKIK